ncbi:MAG: hypothetical protein AAFQ54_09400 [Pseudomonadota bacterium]
MNSPTTKVERRARALIPLAAGRDGRTLLTLASLGDTLTSSPASRDGITWQGPFGDIEPGTEAERQAAAFALVVAQSTTGGLTVKKDLPFDPALGITAMVAALDVESPSERELEGLTVRRGAAALIEPAANQLTAVDLPRLPVVLLHADHELGAGRGPQVATIPEPPDDLSTPEEVADWLRGHVETDADEPAIQEMLDELALTPGASLAAVIPGGAICYAIYPDAATAQGAAAHLEALHPEWWVAETTLS